MILKAIFPYFGSKVRLAAKYSIPFHNTIIEPFAGSAGYSLRHFEKDVVLWEKYDVLYKAWDFYIKATKQDILDLPLIRFGTSIDEYEIPDGAKELISFWMVRGVSTPRKKMTSWAEKYPDRFWGKHTRQVLANQTDLVSHWKIFSGCYSDIPQQTATWFIDPPYFKQGKNYKHSVVDYDHLSAWSKSRQGHVIVCEQEGAEWLDFQPLYSMTNMHRKKRTEVVYEKNSGAMF
jgi:hypothetical protein